MPWRWRRLHPAVLAGAVEVLQDQHELSIQEAYTPHSTCFGCGTFVIRSLHVDKFQPSSPCSETAHSLRTVIAVAMFFTDWIHAGPESRSQLHLRSFRSRGGLTACVKFDLQCQAFPGIVHGGAISAMFECHGNWTAAITLMDRGRLSKPPLTLTKEILVRRAGLLQEQLRQCNTSLECKPGRLTVDYCHAPIAGAVFGADAAPRRSASGQLCHTCGGVQGQSITQGQCPSGPATVQGQHRPYDLQPCHATAEQDVQVMLMFMQVVPGGEEQIFATSTGRFKKVGALRAI